MNNIVKLLSESGLKCTRQRLDVLNAITSSKTPLTAEMIFSQLRNISLSTVYRILEKYTETGIVTRQVLSGSTEIYYEPAFMQHRHYVVCLGCHERQYIDICPVHDTQINNFTVTGHRLELFGYCDKCRQSGAINGK